MSSKGGRPSKLTPEVQADIVKAIRAGNYLEVAAAYAGVSARAVYEWLARGEREEAGDYHAFAQAVRLAQATAETSSVASIMKAAQVGHWAAAAWMLERKHPKRWSSQVNVVLRQEMDDAIERLKVAFADDPDNLERALAAIAGEPSPAAAAGAPGEAGNGAEGDEGPPAT